MDLSVIIPSYRRCDDLDRCLRALARQQRPADEVVVVARADDAPTLALLSRWLSTASADTLPGLRLVTVDEPGQVAANNRGFAAARGDILCLTDDDAAPHPDWLARIGGHFARDASLGGVGGRDRVHEAGRVLQGAANCVGQVRWYGRVIGNHHIGAGAPRDVDVLKGVNMAWRRGAVAGLRFDTRLRGAGAQVHNDLAFSLAVRRAGWRLLYDPALCVDHFPAPRADADQRAVFNAESYYNASYNLHLVLDEHLRATGVPASRRAMAGAWQVLAGSRNYPGWLRALALCLGGEGGRAWRRMALAQRARADALMALHAPDAMRRMPHVVPPTSGVPERAETDVRPDAGGASMTPIGMQQQGRAGADKEKLPW
ncbi:glycosyltransferase family 2 protein [Cupriavidus campinensis]